jgi:NHL repeat-containing protein
VRTEVTGTQPKSTRCGAGISTALATMALACLALAPLAHADLTFGPRGSGAGQTNTPSGLAVDDATGDLYVADRGNKRIDVFDEDGDFIHAFGWGVDTGANAFEVCTTASTCHAGLFGNRGGQFGFESTSFSGPDAIAVDNDPASPSYHDVYVFDKGNARVQRFTPAGAFVLTFGDGVNQTTGGDICTAASGHTCKAGTAGSGPGQLRSEVQIALGLAGTVYVGDWGDGFQRRVQTFNSSGALTGQPLTGSGTISHMAADSNGNFYLADGGSAGVEKFNPAGTCLNCASPPNPSFNKRGLAIDYSSGEILVADTRTPGEIGSAEGLVNLYDPAGNPLSVIFGDEVRRMTALSARHTANGVFYAVHEAGENSKIVHIPIPPSGPIVLPGFQANPSQALNNAAFPIGNTKATLNTNINPEGAGSTTTYHFEYVDDAEFGANGFANAQETAETPVANEIQQLSISATEGQFKLSFGADTTADLPFDASAAQVEAALRALPSIGSPNVAVTRNSGAAISFRITYTGTLANTNVAQLSASSGTVPLKTTLSNGTKEDGSASTTTVIQGGAPFGLYGLSDQITGLVPETTYRFRAIASDGTHTAVGPTATFTTRAPFEFGDTYSTAVGTDTAILHGELNPLEVAATGYFEYVDDATFQVNGFADSTQIPDVSGGDPPLDFGDGENEITRSIELKGLASDTIYHFRLVAEDSFVAKAGPERTFHTFALPDPPNVSCPNQGFRDGLPSAPLPNCRAYEMVSPLAKGGADINEGSVPTCGGGCPARIDQARPDGSALTYSAERPFADSGAATLSNQYIAERDPGAGWQTRSISPPTSSLTYYNLLFDTSFQAFSPDLCTAYYWQWADVALAPGDQPGFADLYRTHNCEEPLGYDLLSTTAPLNPQPAPSGIDSYVPRVQGFSADGSIAVFRANAKLTPNASSATGGTFGPVFQLYLQDGKGLRLVSVMPDGSPAGFDSSVGNRQGVAANFRSDTLARAVSADGTRVFWTSPDAGASPNPKLYVRINANQAQSKFSAGKCSEAAKACTLAVSGSVGPGPAQFLTATADGSKALFKFNQFAPGDLYSYDVATQTPALIAPGVKGLLGVSEDLTKIYLVSTAVLDTAAVAGQNNLYLYEQGQGFTRVATLSNADEFSGAFSPIPYNGPSQGHTSRVSADGSHAAFPSRTPLTGYDNADAASGFPDTEVFLYDAGAGELRCVSCNPTGARPAGREVSGALNGNPTTAKWAAAELPAAEYSHHFSRVLSEDGERLFFQSFDALLPQDTNGKTDVYQWEASDAGDCETADANYFEPNGGCLSLISSGQSPRDAEFLDASADGSDVFLKSAERLHGADTDTLIDIYDARVEGGFPAPPPAAAPCDLGSGACEGPGSSPPSSTGAGSAVFVGPGNQAARPERTCPKGKRKVTRRGKARCVAKGKARKGKGQRKGRAANSNGRATR